MVEQLAIKAVSDWKVIITVLKSICKHGGERHAERYRCQYTAKPDSVCYRKRFRVHAIVLDPCRQAIMELPHHSYKPGWTAKLCHNFPKPITTDCFKCFGKVDKGHVAVYSVYLAFLLELPSCKEHVCCSSVLPKSTLTFWSRCSFRRFSRIFAIIFPAIDNKEMLLWFSQT